MISIDGQSLTLAQFQDVVFYRVGESAQKTVKAIQTFTTEDREATALKREAAARRASAVFDLDLRVNDRLEAELRHAFDTGRCFLSIYFDTAVDTNRIFSFLDGSFFFFRFKPFIACIIF